DAQVKLVDLLKDKQTVREASDEHKVSFAPATELYKKRVQDDHCMKKRSRGCRLLCLRKIESTWPGLSSRFLGETAEAECGEWATKLKAEIASQYFNNVIGTFKLIVDEGSKEQKRLGGNAIDNPAEELSLPRIGWS
ncbi:MAG TPA: hypothetical protein VL970_07445, partial [Candidatus Acidoferrales bacterium]|nr:hypothetical protein [Candidatus Acidoferrales bacterium]